MKKQIFLSIILSSIFVSTILVNTFLALDFISVSFQKKYTVDYSSMDIPTIIEEELQQEDDSDHSHFDDFKSLFVFQFFESKDFNILSNQSFFNYLSIYSLAVTFDSNEFIKNRNIRI
ncbi:MAG: hypothetical protein ACK5D5_03575 [Bacteroidota bacterium]